ncbi:uncharacterized protein BT62DRAFT_926443 [Guyanagaster necrorhizus]|uniref:Uncharacterized protein n=1 Tax=Guyanagaster necrorhizus TaxID=856835 RepID=A0A9P7W408_9AGAR|nr:uncharacterized protein BT62DRAFT_926443 [Guyanagaster necrorhizus MCA 3950]KAG7452233.1 hypothetical protein BT62DRAFT_926443 [Guyanagaster necrorhizus MCA 3950]
MTPIPGKQFAVGSLDADLQAQAHISSLACQPVPITTLDRSRQPKGQRRPIREVFGGVPIAFGPILFCYDWDRGEEADEDYKTPPLEEMVKAKL